MCNLYYLLRTCINLFMTLLFKLTNFTLFAIQNLSFYSSHSGSLILAYCMDLLVRITCFSIEYHSESVIFLEDSLKIQSYMPKFKKEEKFK